MLEPQMSFDPEFMRLVKTMGAEDAVRKAEAAANAAAEEQRIKALGDVRARYEEFQIIRQAREQEQEEELLRKGRTTLATAHTLSALAVERHIPQDIEIGYLVKGSLGRLRRSQRIVQATGWRVERNIVGPTRVAVEKRKGMFMEWLDAQGSDSDGYLTTDEEAKIEAERERLREYKTVPGYEYGVLLASTGKLYHYHDRGNDDPQSSAPAIVTMPDPSALIGEPRPGGYDRGIWDHSKWYGRRSQEAWAYPSEGYDRALARFAIDHTLLLQA
jgi:hypothetical protein